MFTKDLLPLWPRARIGVMSDLSDFLREVSPPPMTVRAAARVRVGRGEWPSPPEMVCLRQDALARTVVSLVLGRKGAVTPRKLELRRIHGGWVWLRSVLLPLGLKVRGLYG